MSFDLFYSVGMLICALMIVVWLLRVRSKGLGAWLMASAFAVFGFLLFAMKNEAPRSLLIGLGVSLFALLVGDAAVRLRNQGKEIGS